MVIGIILFVGLLAVTFGLTKSRISDFKEAGDDKKKAAKSAAFACLYGSFTFFLVGIVVLGAMEKFDLLPGSKDVEVATDYSNTNGYIDSGSDTYSGSDSYSSSLKTCPSCGEKVSNLITREVIKGNGDWQSWCSDCWEHYDSISPYSNSEETDYDRALDEVSKAYGISKSELDAAYRAQYGFD